MTEADITGPDPFDPAKLDDETLEVWTDAMERNLNEYQDMGISISAREWPAEKDVQKDELLQRIATRMAIIRGRLDRMHSVMDDRAASNKSVSLKKMNNVERVACTEASLHVMKRESIVEIEELVTRQIEVAAGIIEHVERMRTSARDRQDIDALESLNAEYLKYGREHARLTAELEIIRKFLAENPANDDED